MAKTFWHFEEKRKLPSDYELATERLFYFHEQGFETSPPLKSWFDKYLHGSELTVNALENFSDPEELYYSTYVKHQNKRQQLILGILASRQNPDYLASLSREWLAELRAVLCPVVFPWHALQMAAAYLGHLAPNSKVAVVFMLQAANEMKRIENTARLLVQHEGVYPGFAKDRKRLWCEDQRWQPLRDTLEKILTVYDWGKAFTALNLAIKPGFDDFVLEEFANKAQRAGDYLTCEFLRAHQPDSLWQRRWTQTLAHILAENPSNKPLMKKWQEIWSEKITQAIATLR